MAGILVRILIIMAGLWVADAIVPGVDADGAGTLLLAAIVLGLVAWLLDGFSVDGFFPALFGSLLVSITSWAAASFVGPSGRYEVLVIERRR